MSYTKKKGWVSPLKGRKRTPEEIAKYRATRAANKVAKACGELVVAPEDRTKDAMIFISHAIRVLNKKHANAATPPTELLYVQLALRTLQGVV